MEEYFFKLMNVTDEYITDCRKEKSSLNHEQVASNFIEKLKNEYSDQELCKLITCAGFIPDLYESDSSEETLYTKLLEVLVAEWGNRMGYNAHYVKEKSSYEDVNMIIGGKIVVCDAKSFRLGRSQMAPNVKDFLKLEDVRKWLNRYEEKLGGLITYPDTHEWTKGSDAYLYCSTKDCPTVMLPYIYLSLLLNFKDHFDTSTLAELWQYERLFPKPLPKKSKTGNRKLYWDVIDKELIRIMGITDSEFTSYLKKCKSLQSKCIKKNYDLIKEYKSNIVKEIKLEAKTMTEQEVRENFAKYKINTMTKNLDNFMERIENFRMKK